MVRCPAVESLLCERASGMSLPPGTPPTSPPFVSLLTSALAALPGDLGLVEGDAGRDTSPEHARYLLSVAEGLLLQGLTALLLAPPGAAAAAQPGTNGVLEEGEEPSATGGTTSGTDPVNGSSGSVSDCDGSADGSPAAGYLPCKLQSPDVAGGKQDFPAPDPAFFPLTQPIMKNNVLQQATGTAPYTDDVPVARDALFAAWVLSTVARGRVSSIDTAAALQVPGAVRFIGPEDVPGENVVGMQALWEQRVVVIGLALHAVCCSHHYLYSLDVQARALLWSAWLPVRSSMMHHLPPSLPVHHTGGPHQPDGEGVLRRAAVCT